MRQLHLRVWENSVDIADQAEARSIAFDTRPVKLGCETVNLCNNDCVFCGYGLQTRPKGYMTLDVYRKVLGDYSDMGGGYISLTPTVGEVFLDRHLLERLRIAQEYPKIEGLVATTNAAMAHRFEEHELKFIVESFRQLHISVYGLDEEEYFALTKKRTYSKMLDGIRRLFLYSNGNVKLLFRLAKTRPPDALHRWFQESILPWLTTERAKRELPLPPVIAAHVQSEYMNWGRLDTSVQLPFDATWKPDVINTEQCAIPKLTHVVLSNGDVAFCHCANFDNVEELRLGNIRESSLSEMLASERLRRLWDWKTFGVPEFCKTCSAHLPMSSLAIPDFLDPESFP
jgi:radical SAM protein with 4Fe4S-binding SPASM domain